MLGLAAFKIVVVVSATIFVIYLAQQSAAGELTPFERGFLGGMEYEPDAFSFGDAGHIAGSIFPSGVLAIGYIVGVLAKWRNFLIGVFIMEAMAAVANDQTGLLMVALFAWLLFNKRAQAHLRT